MSNLLVSVLLLVAFSTPPQQDNCRNRLSYVHFDEMTKTQRTLWLYCAFEKLKQGEDKHMKTYSAWSKKTPNYKELMKEWKAISGQKKQ